VSAEDIKIYGFAGELERDLFDICRGVKGVGGRTALAAIDHLTPAALIATVLDEDASKLATVPGIGPKTAERIVFELKSKRRQMQLLKAQEGGISGSQSAYVEEVLRSLGYDAQEIGSALANCHGNDDEELLRACLRRLSA
jgi:Holliday junction DNA helicase RuvA